MKLLDEDGRLFGVINLIDASAVLLAIGIVVAGAVVFVPGFLEQESNEEMTIRFQANNAPTYVVNSTEIGPVPSNDNVIAVLNKSARSPTATPNGSTTSMTLWARTRVSVNGGELYFDDQRIYVGKQVTLDLGNVVVGTTVTKIEANNSS